MWEWNVKDLIEDLKSPYGCDPDWDEIAYRLASTSEKAKQELIQAFNEEQDEFHKTCCANTLAQVGEKCVIPFLLELIKKNSNVVIASFSLLHLNYPDIKDIFIQIYTTNINYQFEIFDKLYRINTPLSNEILEELVKQDKELVEIIEERKANPEKYSREINNFDW